MNTTTAFVIDEDGFFIDVVTIYVGDEIPSNYILTAWRESLYKPRYNKETSEWEEGLTEPEIEKLLSNEPTLTQVEIMAQQMTDLEINLLENKELIECLGRTVTELEIELLGLKEGRK